MPEDRFLPDLILKSFEASWRSATLEKLAVTEEIRKSRPMIIANDLRREVKKWFGSLEPQLFVTRLRLLHSQQPQQSAIVKRTRISSSTTKTAHRRVVTHS